MAHYLIEIRFLGSAKYEIKRLIWEIDKKFRLSFAKYHRPVPHVTLAGPLSTKSERRLIFDFKNLCENQQLMHFKLSGYGTFDNTRVVYINIEPDEKLNRFRLELSRKLQSYCSLKPIDIETKFYFHATIAMKISPEKFGKIKHYIKTKEELNHNYCLMRAALIKNQKILYEYDFLLKKLLNREEAKNKKVMSQTFNKLKLYQKNRGKSL